ncbi:MAG TPA: VWA domain-containing protein [Pyrinomonadaceae bacterium]|nr:VWA domain-containing protein [Pyrinomonadaceae bacterium]
MRHKTLVYPPVILVSLLVLFSSTSAQEPCLNQDEIKKMVEQVNSRAPVAFDKKLNRELLELQEKIQEQLNQAISEDRKQETLMKQMRIAREKNTLRLCKILKQYGWPTTALAGKEGVGAAFFVVRNSVLAQLRADLKPVIVASAMAGDISRPDFASYVDSLRLNAGLKQLFGTQATIIDGFLVLFPIEAETKVDERRKQYGLPPLADFLRFLELKYRLPLVKSTGALTNQFSDRVKSSIAQISSGMLDGETVNEDEVVRVETNLVSLNVSVHSNKLRTQVQTLSQNDFSVSEDGHNETITYFATMDAPFDLVLLIDLSGSTSSKRKLIRTSTRRFIEATRPSDRVAIVTFSSTPEVLSPLTDDRAKLIESVNGIGDEVGGSSVWDALKFTLDRVLEPRTLTRRRAVVFMTDGVDNAMADWQRGSRISFADLVEAVRRDDSLIIPVYLDTEGDEFRGSYNSRIYENARKTLTRLADESGGLYYKAKKIEDLDGVYGQVIADLGKIYSLGYKPSNDKRDGTWRTVKIQVPTLPDVSTRARPGYYAN